MPETFIKMPLRSKLGTILGTQKPVRYRPISRSSTMLIILFPSVLAALLYWPTLQLPLLFDDLLHIRLAKNVDFMSVWLPSTDFGFYRPNIFLPFLLVKQVFGYYPSILLHFFNIAQQAINTALLAALIWRVWHKWPHTLAAGILFASYPFAYQAIAFYGNNVYPFSAGLILLALHMYLSAIRKPTGLSRTAHWLATGFIFCIGLLTHETFVLFGPFAALIHWAAKKRIYFSFKTPYLFFIIIGGLYIVVYQFLPTGGGPTPDEGSNALWPKLLYLLQTVAYPTTWIAHFLPRRLSPFILLSSFALIVTLTIWSARRPDNRLPLLAGWSWWAMASLLIGINLPTYYIEHGARLTYLSGVGAAFIWVFALEPLWMLPRAKRVAWVGSVTVIVISSGVFVRGRLAAFAEIASPVEVIKEKMVGQPTDEGILLVNLPAWTSPPRLTYATGVEYVTLMGRHLFAEELIEENLRGNWPVLAVDVPDLFGKARNDFYGVYSQGQHKAIYFYGVHAQAHLDAIPADWAVNGSHVFITHYTPKGIRTRYTGQFVPPTRFSLSRPVATFGPYHLLQASATQCDDRVTVTLKWQPEDDLAPALLLILQLLDSGGSVIAQQSAPPLGLHPDKLTIPAGWTLIERREFTVGNVIPQELALSIYDLSTGSALSGFSVNGRPLDTWRTTIMDCLPLHE